MATDRVEAVERALGILGAFTAEQGALSLRDIAAATGLYKSTILRLCGSLEHFGYLRRDADGRFWLGPAVLTLGELYRRHFDFGPHVRPVLRALVEATNETASFYVRDGDERVCVMRHEAPRPIRHHVDEGAALPLDQGAAGHVLKAFGEEGDWAVRTAGFAVSIGERDPHAAAIAAPVFGREERLLGALAVSGLAERFTSEAQQAIRAAVLDAAKRLSWTLGAAP